jgi:fucose 4-O-acetylase-like acetyltransferase
MTFVAEPRGSAHARARAVGSGPRVAYLDNLKFLLVAVIIVGHGALAYSTLESAWPYQDIQEVQLGAVSDFVLLTIVIPAALFSMGLFFLISGLVAPGSMARKGPGAFARDRAVRLGIPLVVWTLIAWPGAIWVSFRVVGDTRSFWDQLLVDADPFLDPGPMWFVGVLLIYSLAYAAWCRRHEGRHRAAVTSSATPLSGRELALVAAGIAVATVLVRPLFPITSAQIGQLKLFQWPQFAAMFALGIVAARRGGLTTVPASVRRGCGFAALGGIAAFLALFAIAAMVGDEDVVYDTGIHWAPLVLAAVEGPLAVGASVWLLAVAQARLDRRPGRLGRALSRSAYAAFLSQGVVLLALMIALRPLALDAEVKALAAGGLGAAGSFALAWLAVSRTSLGRVL